MGNGIGSSEQDGFHLAVGICGGLVPCNGVEADSERGAIDQGEQMACRRGQQDEEGAWLAEEEEELSELRAV